MPAEHESPGETSPSGDHPSHFEVNAISAPLRVAIVALEVIAVLNLLYIAAAIVHDIFEGTQAAPPLVVAFGLTVFSGLPWALAALLLRLAKGTLEVEASQLVLSLRQARFEIPRSSVKDVRPLRLPLPGAGVALEMSSGRLFRYRLQSADPSELMSAVCATLPSAQSPQKPPSIAYARAKYELGRRGWVYWFVKYGLLPLAITLILFRLHQYIVFGGFFGQYHLLGLGPYLKTFGTYWASTMGGLVVYAGVVRLVFEALALPLTWALPARARIIRHAVEILCQFSYFGLAPAYVAARLLL